MTSAAGHYVVRGRGRLRGERFSFHEGDSLFAGYGGTSEGSRIGVRYTEATRETGSLGGFKTVERSGWVRDHLIISGNRAGAVVPTTAAGVKTALRRIRDQEADVLDRVDAEIEALKVQLKGAQVRRRHALREAFNHGHVVRLSEVVEHADALAAKGSEVAS